MSRRRVEFSLSSLETILLLCSSLIVLLLSFVLGVMVGKSDIKGLPDFEKEVKSDVVKMKIESTPPIEQPSVNAASYDKKIEVMNNITSKPVMTFYDTLAKKGTTKKEPSSRNTNNKEAKKDKSSRKFYSIQAGSTRDKSSADALVSKLKANGYSAYITSSESSEKETWYKVRLGTFSTRDDARKEAGRIEKNEGISAVVVEK